MTGRWWLDAVVLGIGGLALLWAAALVALFLVRPKGPLLGYLALPIDLVPDFVPVLGYADDVAVIALTLRAVVRRAGPEALERHWTGSESGLAAVRRLAGLAPTGGA